MVKYYQVPGLAISVGEHDIYSKTCLEFTTVQTWQENHHVKASYSVADLVNAAVPLTAGPISSEDAPSFTHSLERAVIDKFNLEAGKVICRYGICGRPDFIYHGFPGEIKTKRHFRPTSTSDAFFIRAVLQLGLYAYLMERSRGILLIASYDSVLGDITYATIYRYPVTVSGQLDQEKFRSMARL